MHADLDSLTFEEAFAELQGVVEELRGDALTLERALELYQRGSILAGHCNMLLTAAELRITQSDPRDGSGRTLHDSFLETDW